MTAEDESAASKPLARLVRSKLRGRSVILVGMMGSGKSSIGRRLACALDLPFVDADAEIEAAAGMTIEEMFARHGEQYFRDGEERVIRRLLQSGPHVLSTGGGAVVSAQTRAAIARSGLSVWLDAPIELLLHRVMRRDNRPLLKKSDPRIVLERLLVERQPYYAEAHVRFESRDVAHEVAVDELLARLAAYFEPQDVAKQQEKEG